MLNLWESYANYGLSLHLIRYKIQIQKKNCVLPNVISHWSCGLWFQRVGTGQQASWQHSRHLLWHICDKKKSRLTYYCFRCMLTCLCAFLIMTSMGIHFNAPRNSSNKWFEQTCSGWLHIPFLLIELSITLPAPLQCLLCDIKWHSLHMATLDIPQRNHWVFDYAPKYSFKIKTDSIDWIVSEGDNVRYGMMANLWISTQTHLRVSLGGVKNIKC